MGTGRIAVVGGGIAGLAAAHALTRIGRDVVVFEASAGPGGRIQSSPFAGLDSIDEGADAFLARVPEATDLARQVGLGDDLTHPERVGAAVWHDGLHAIPEGLLLGVPGKPLPLARSGLLSWRGKLRAGLEPFLPRTSLESDSIGQFVRARFGDEVHERLVDALVGSIYATDTDRFSLEQVPQLDALARRHRSLLLGARATSVAGTASAEAAPIFAAPRGGVGALPASTARSIVESGGEVRYNSGVEALGAADGGWDVDGERFDAVIAATPAAATSRLVNDIAADTAALLSTAETSDVILVSLHVAASEWPDRLAGRSGYLVPKPVQRTITAVSFGSQKWRHWQPPAGGQILRASLGRDGQPALHLDDDQVVDRVLDDLHRHLDLRISPLEVRVSRWPGAFAQYRPHHSRWVDEVESTLPPGLFVTGSSYRGIGIPACIRQGRTIAELAADHVRGLT